MNDFGLKWEEFQIFLLPPPSLHWYLSHWWEGCLICAPHRWGADPGQRGRDTLLLLGESGRPPFQMVFPDTAGRTGLLLSKYVGPDSLLRFLWHHLTVGFGSGCLVPCYSLGSMEVEVPHSASAEMGGTAFLVWLPQGELYCLKVSCLAKLPLFLSFGWREHAFLWASKISPVGLPWSPASSSAPIWVIGGRRKPRVLTGMPFLGSQDPWLCCLLLFTFQNLFKFLSYLMSRVLSCT